MDTRDARAGVDMAQLDRALWHATLFFLAIIAGICFMVVRYQMQHAKCEGRGTMEWVRRPEIDGGGWMERCVAR